MKTLTNWNIIIVGNCSNVQYDKVTTTVNHTRYNMLLYIYNHVITKTCVQPTTSPILRVLGVPVGISNQSPESASNVVYSFTALPLELIQYKYNLGDCGCSAITPLSLLPDIHICCPGSNGSRVAICSMTCIKIFLTVGFLHCLVLTDTSF